MKVFVLALVCLWSVVDAQKPVCTVAAVCNGKAEFRPLPTQGQVNKWPNVSPCPGVPTPPANPCGEPGWETLDGGYQYKVVAAKADWKTAQKFCRNEGAAVAYDGIRNRKVMQDLVEYLRKRGAIDGFWIGLSDMDKYGTWKWTDGQKLADNEIWASGQPDNWGGNQHCGWISRDKGYKVDDGECDVMFQVLCERKV